MIRRSAADPKISSRAKRTLSSAWDRTVGANQPGSVAGSCPPPAEICGSSSMSDSTSSHPSWSCLILMSAPSIAAVPSGRPAIKYLAAQTKQSTAAL